MAITNQQTFSALQGVSGLSMGGVHACMVASLCPMDLACSPLLAPRSAAVAFCEGMLQFGIQDWGPLASSMDECANVGKKQLIKLNPSLMQNHPSQSWMICI